MYFGLGAAERSALGGPSDEPGWPQLLNGYVYTSSPVLADLEGTGKLNIIVGDQAGFIYAYRPNGTLLWSYDARNAYPISMQDPAGEHHDSIIAFGCGR